MRKILLLAGHVTSSLIGWLDRIEDMLYGPPPMIPAGPEVGCDDQGSFCSGWSTGETAGVFVSPLKSLPADLDRLEELASGSLGPSDPRLLGQGARGPVVLR